MLNENFVLVVTITYRLLHLYGPETLIISSNAGSKTISGRFNQTYRKVSNISRTFVGN